VGLERCQLSLASTIKELLERKCSCSGLGNRGYSLRGSAALTTLHRYYPQKLALTSPTSGVCSVGIVRSRTHTTLLVCRIVNCAAERVARNAISVFPVPHWWSYQDPKKGQTVECPLRVRPFHSLSIYCCYSRHTKLLNSVGRNECVLILWLDIRDVRNQIPSLPQTWKITDFIHTITVKTKSHVRTFQPSRAR
jgi:hypothetical protein